MAAFSDVGALCDICGSQDFLPLKCDTCPRVFCESCFRDPEKHNCLSSSANTSTVGNGDRRARTSHQDAEVDDDEDLYGDGVPGGEGGKGNAGTNGVSTMTGGGGASSSTGAAQLECFQCHIKLIPEKSCVCPICDKVTCFRHRFEDDHDCFDFFKELTQRFGERPTGQPISDEQWTLVFRIIQNLIKKQDDKFRILKRSNETLRSQIFSSIPMMRIMTGLGFATNGEAGLTLPVAQVARVARVWQQNRGVAETFKTKTEAILLLPHARSGAGAGQGKNVDEAAPRGSTTSSLSAGTSASNTPYLSRKVSENATSQAAPATGFQPPQRQSSVGTSAVTSSSKTAGP
ncbi:unnamed protein product, partial [Amoebophrya sp. A25]|eukprot:GSA25T00017752001.1